MKLFPPITLRHVSHLSLKPKNPTLLTYQNKKLKFNLVQRCEALMTTLSTLLSTLKHLTQSLRDTGTDFC